MKHAGCNYDWIDAKGRFCSKSALIPPGISEPSCLGPCFYFSSLFFHIFFQTGFYLHPSPFSFIFNSLVSFLNLSFSLKESRATQRPQMRQVHRSGLAELKDGPVSNCSLLCITSGNAEQVVLWNVHITMNRSVEPLFLVFLITKTPFLGFF